MALVVCGVWTTMTTILWDKVYGQATLVHRVEAGTEYPLYSQRYRVYPHVYQGFTYTPWLNLLREWSELWSIAVKLSQGVLLSEHEVRWVNEVSEATGWDPEDIIEDLKALTANPIERADRYRELFTEYLRRAKEHFNKGDLKQAGEKLYAATLALIKFYASIKNIPIIHWSRGKIERFITSSVEAEYKETFRDLLDKVQPLHEHYYEGHLDEETFKERWNRALNLIEKAKEAVLKHHTHKM